MNIFLYVIAIMLVVAIVTISRKTEGNERPIRIYTYKSKDRIMTKAEARFFEKLIRVTGDRFFILPQVHLSTFIEHKIKGQNWKGAFSAINGKSVDFLLVEKDTLKPALAIELDDWSHKREDRIARDGKVKNIMKDANILLVRFDNPDISDQTIVEKVYQLVQAADEETRK